MMNKRILEFARQAGFIVPTVGIVSEDFNIKTENGTDVNQELERFAELLIKRCFDECVKVSYTYHTEATTDSTEDGEGPDPYASGAYYATIKCRTAIKNLLG